MYNWKDDGDDDDDAIMGAAALLQMWLECGRRGMGIWSSWDNEIVKWKLDF